jgi:hypothetical protein
MQRDRRRGSCWQEGRALPSPEHADEDTMKRTGHYQPQVNNNEIFLVVDVDREAEACGQWMRAHMTARGDEDSPIADKAAAEMPALVLEWCEKNVVLDREDCFAIAPEIIAHDGLLPLGYSGGGIAIQVHTEPPRRVLRALKERALACAKDINAHAANFAHERVGFKVLGFRMVSRWTTDTSVEV